MLTRIASTATLACLISAAPALAQAPAPGWTAELSTLAHGVRGTVVVVDETTIRIDDFFFDGRGRPRRARTRAASPAASPWAPSSWACPFPAAA